MRKMENLTANVQKATAELRELAIAKLAELRASFVGAPAFAFAA